MQQSPIQVAGSPNAVSRTHADTHLHQKATPIYRSDHLVYIAFNNGTPFSGNPEDSIRAFTNIVKIPCHRRGGGIPGFSTVDGGEYCARIPDDPAAIRIGKIGIVQIRVAATSLGIPCIAAIIPYHQKTRSVRAGSGSRRSARASTSPAHKRPVGDTRGRVVPSRKLIWKTSLPRQ